MKRRVDRFDRVVPKISRRPLYWLALLLLPMVGAGVLWVGHTAKSLAAATLKSQRGTQPDRVNHSRALADYAKLPLAFEINEGQTDPRVKFLSRTAAYTLFLTGNEAVLSLRQSRVDRLQSPTPAAMASLERHALHPKGKPRGEAAARGDRTRDAVLQMKLVGADPAAPVTGFDELPGKTNYFIGNDPKKWRTDVPNYAKAEYKGVYPGVNLVYYGNQGQLEYDFVVAPGASPSAIRLDVGAGLMPGGKDHSQAAPLRIAANGDLVMNAAGGEVRLHKPVVYQPAATRPWSILPHWPLGTTERESRTADLVPATYVLNGDDVGFKISHYDRTRPLVIDPVLTYSSLLGGSGFYGEWGGAIAVDSSGNVYLTGQTDSTDFPNVNQIPGACVGYCDTGLYTVDAFVTKIDAAGDAIVYSSFIGGSNTYGPDYGLGIALDSSGATYLTGVAGSSDFPTVNQIPGACVSTTYDCALSGAAFVTKIDAGGDTLVYSSLIGGESYDTPYGIAVDASGDAYLTGYTESSDFPIVNQISGACVSTCGSWESAFAVEVNPAGTALNYSTLLGGDNEAYGNAIALDSSGNVYVAGYTNSSDFPQVNPTPGACVGACGTGNAYYDGFVTEINAAGSALTYSTLLGGSEGGELGSLALDSSGNIYLAGYTISADFPQVNPIPGACQGTCGTGDGANPDGFVTKINAGGSALAYSSLFGGSGGEGPGGIAVDTSGNVFITGGTSSTDFPLVNPISGACTSGCGSGPPVGFVMEVSAGAASLVYSSYLGGNTGFLGDSGAGIRVDGQDNVYLTGYTTSTNFPEVNQILGACNGTCGQEGNFEVIAVKIAASNQNATYTFPDGLAFGPTRAKTQRIILTNSEHTPLSITRINITGVDSQDFSQSNNCPVSPRTLPSGGYCTIAVSFLPHKSGKVTAALGVRDNAPGSPQEVALFGAPK